MTTTDTLTDDRIRALRTNAASAGDMAMVLICDLAVGDVSIDTTIDELRIAAFIDPPLKRKIAAMDRNQCREECARVIADVEAQEDGSTRPNSFAARWTP